MISPRRPQRGQFTPARWRPRTAAAAPVKAMAMATAPGSARTWAEFTKNLWPPSPATKIATATRAPVAAWVAQQLRQRDAWAAELQRARQAARLSAIAEEVLHVADVTTPATVKIGSLPAPFAGLVSRDEAGNYLITLDDNRALRHERLTQVMAHELAHLVAGHVAPGAKGLPAYTGAAEYASMPIEREATDLGARIEAYITRRWGRLDTLVAQTA